MQLISFLALYKHFKFTALFDHCKISRKHYYIHLQMNQRGENFNGLSTVSSQKPASLAPEAFFLIIPLCVWWTIQPCINVEIIIITLENYS